MQAPRRFSECPCGRKIAHQNMRVHAGSCAHARNAGWETPPERVTQCKCGCKTRIVSYSTKAKRFVDKRHREAWRMLQPGEKEDARLRRQRCDEQRSLKEVAEQHEQKAMTPVQRGEAELRALYEHSNATFFTSPTYWSAERIRLEAMSWK